MKHDFLDHHSRLDSPVHRVPAGLKLAAAVAVVVATLVSPVVLAPVAVGLVIVAGLSRIPPGWLLRRMLLLEPFVLGVAVLAFFQPNGGWIFAGIVAKSSLCLLTMILLSNTTPFAELLRVLRQARVPALLVTTLALMYRYLFVLVDETERMQRARASRTFTGGRLAVWRSLGMIIGQLFVRSSERAERIYAAMCARGWK